jgi:HEAT repeat protein
MAMIVVILLGLGCTASGQGQMSDRVFGQVVVIEISGVVDEIQGDAICRRIPQLMPPGEYVTKFGTVENGKLWSRVAPIPDVKAFAGKIDFGKVTAIRERTIYVKATPVTGAGTAAASPLNRALEGLKSSNADTRHSALEQLIAMKPNSARDEVVKVLQAPLNNSDDRTGKGLAVKALVQWNGKASIPTLLKVTGSNDHRDYLARAAAIDALAQFKDPATIVPIARRVTDVSDRRHAVEALIAFGPLAEKATLSVLTNKDGDTRIGACQVLEKIGGKASVASLEALTKDVNKRLSSAATSALKAVKKRAGKGGRQS